VELNRTRQLGSLPYPPSTPFIRLQGGSIGKEEKGRHRIEVPRPTVGGGVERLRPNLRIRATRLRKELVGIIRGRGTCNVKIEARIILLARSQINRGRGGGKEGNEREKFQKSLYFVSKESGDQELRTFPNRAIEAGLPAGGDRL